MKRLRPIGLLGTLVRFGIPTLAMFAVFEFVIPALGRAGLRMPLPWFAGGSVVFAGMLTAVVASLRAEGTGRSWSTLAERLRLRSLDRADWMYALGAVAVIGLLEVGVMTASEVASRTLGAPALSPVPPALQFDPLGPGDLWILLVWLPFWMLNILGEELWWRGVILPRQEVAFGAHAWWVHALGWLIFHAAFGLQMPLFIAPIVFVQSWVCVRRRSTTVGIVVHGLANGPAFVAVALGWV